MPLQLNKVTLTFFTQLAQLFSHYRDVKGKSALTPVSLHLNINYFFNY